MSKQERMEGKRRCMGKRRNIVDGEDNRRQSGAIQT